MGNHSIRTKAEFLSRSSSGLLGNTMPSWDSVEDARADGYHGPVMIRYREPGSPFMRPDVDQSDVPDVIASLVDQGADPGKVYLTWMSRPGPARRLNAEVWRGPGGLYVNYSTAQTHLREALDLDGHHAERSAAVAILRSYLDPSSYDDIQDFLDMYPDHVVELTSYASPIGSFKDSGRSCIVWEVRGY